MLRSFARSLKTSDQTLYSARRIQEPEGDLGVDLSQGQQATPDKLSSILYPKQLISDIKGLCNTSREICQKFVVLEKKKENKLVVLISKTPW